MTEHIIPPDTMWTSLDSSSSATMSPHPTFLHPCVTQQALAVHLASHILNLRERPLYKLPSYPTWGPQSHPGFSLLPIPKSNQRPASGPPI